MIFLFNQILYGLVHLVLLMYCRERVNIWTPPDENNLRYPKSENAEEGMYLLEQKYG